MKNRVHSFIIGWLVLLGASGYSAPQHQIDEWVSLKLAESGAKISPRCSDDVFLRRVYLDVIGGIPAPETARSFMKRSGSSAKRAQLIDHLLERDDFSVYLGLKWCDRLRVKAEFPSNLWPNAVQAYHRWVVDAFRSNMPYDQFARALLTTSGSNFRDAPVNFYRPFQTRAPRNLFETVALVFMGMRLDHSGFSEDDLLGMDAFFSKVAYKKTAEWKEEIVYFDPTATFNYPDSDTPVVPKPFGGDPIELGQFDDPRVAFADWLTAPENPWFARAMVNRIWHHLLGRGLIHEVDDIRPENPPWSEELMRFLEQQFVDSGYDVRHLYRIILNSTLYQSSSEPVDAQKDSEATFVHYRVRRMDAEVLVDALCRITGSFEKYSSAIPEPFTFIPKKQRSISLADGSIKSQFLEMFGRPGRDTSYESDRNNDVSVFQSLHMLNSTHIANKINTGWKLKQIYKKEKSPARRIEELYLTVLSRFPTDAERKVVSNYSRSSGLDGRQVFNDIAWGLINSKEFMLRH